MKYNSSNSGARGNLLQVKWQFPDKVAMNITHPFFQALAYSVYKRVLRT